MKNIYININYILLFVKHVKTKKQTNKQKSKNKKSKTREDIAHEIGIKTSHNKSHWHLKITKVNLKASF